MTPKITCRQAIAYINKREENSLSRSARFRLWEHLGECSLCRNFNTQNQIIEFAYKNIPHPAELTSADKDRIIENVLNDKASK